MKKLRLLLAALPLFLLSACDVHEWPGLPESMQLHLRLHYETDMTEWPHQYDGTTLIEQGVGATYDNRLTSGEIRYMVRLYPATEGQRTVSSPAQEFIFTKDIAQGYDHQVTLDVLPGDYQVMVWSDLVETPGSTPFYNAGNFAEIALQGDYTGNTDHRDAFRGTSTVSLVADITNRAADTLDVTMQRPLAKFQLITTDVQEFIDKEVENLRKEALTRGEEDLPTRVDAEDYRVVVQYTGFMPTAYNMHTDKPVDSRSGVSFESQLEMLTDSEASLGFDYVFVNGTDAGVSVQVGLYDKQGKQVSLSEPIEVPLQRNRHTILKGSFLMQQASGGITIHPDFDGNHNIVIE